MGLVVTNDTKVLTTGIAVRRVADSSQGGDTKCLYDRVPLLPGASREYPWLGAGTYCAVLESGTSKTEVTLVVEGDEAPAAPAAPKASRARKSAAADAPSDPK